MATDFIQMDLPAPEVTLGPDWATKLNTALLLIDEHDHSSGKGARITPSGLNINADLEMNGNALTEVEHIALQNLLAAAGNATLYFKNGEFYVKDPSGNEIQMTTSGTINVGSVGGITQDYGVGSSEVAYDDATKTYYFRDSTAAEGNINAGDAALKDITTDSIVNLNSITSTGGFVGPGAIPVGTVIPIMSNITGSHTIPASGTRDSWGLQLCDGAAFAAGSTLSGNTPNLTDERFLVGSTVAGSTGGANSITPAGTIGGSQSHTHSVSHYHTFAHNHQTAWRDSDGVPQGATSSSATQAQWTTSGALGITGFSSAGVTSGGSYNAWIKTGGVSTQYFYSSGVLNPPAGTSISDPRTSDVSNGTSGSTTINGSNFTFTGSAFNNRPLYLTTRYCIRAK